MRHQSNRGFTIIESLIALACFAIVMVIGVTVISSAGHGFAREATTIRSQTSLDRLADQMTASAHTSVAVFTPTSCGGAGAGDGQACSQLRFDGVDSSGATHIWGWEYAAGVLKECLSYPDADDGCTKYGAATTVSAFSATPTTVDNLPVTTALGYAPASKESEVGDAASDPNGRVVAGNRVMVVQYADANVEREVHLLQGGTPFTAAVLKGAFTPPNLGNLSTGISPSNNLFFQSATATGCSYGAYTANPPAGCSITATESNYSQYQPYIAPPYWSVGPCLSGATTIANVAQTAGGGDSATYGITPVAAGSCSFTISTHDQSVNINVVVYAVPTYPLSISGVSSANILDTQTDTISASAPLNPPAAGTSYPPGTPGSANVEIATLTGNVTNNTLGWQASGTTFTMTGNAYSTANGMIAALPPVSNAVIVNNDQAFSFNVWDPPIYQITVSTNSLTVQVGTTASWAGGSNIQNPVQAGEPQGIAPSTLSVYYNNGTGNCQWPTGGAMLTTATFGVIPNDTAGCTAQVQDTAGDPPQTVVINGFWPTLFPGNPTCVGTSPSTISCDSTPPTGGSGMGYQVTYSGGGTSCGPAVYACSLGGLTPSTLYGIVATYQDSAGNTATNSTFATTLASPNVVLLDVPAGTQFTDVGVCFSGNDPGAWIGGMNCLGRVSVTESFSVDTPTSAMLVLSATVPGLPGNFAPLGVGTVCTTMPCLNLTYPDGNTVNLTPSVGYGIDGPSRAHCLQAPDPGNLGCNYDVSLPMALTETGTYTFTFASGTLGLGGNPAVGEPLSNSFPMTITQFTITTF